MLYSKCLLIYFFENQWTGKACEADGIKFEVREVDKMDLESALDAANRDPLVHGIMIYYPCFGAAPSFYGGNMDDYLRDSVPIEKDVEGLCHTYRHHLYHNIRYIDNEVITAEFRKPALRRTCDNALRATGRQIFGRHWPPKGKRPFRDQEVAPPVHPTRHHQAHGVP